MSDFSPDDAAYLTADKHKKKHSSNSSDGGERKRSSSKKQQPKGILKNSNPNATYHEEPNTKSGRNKRVDELVEYDRPKSSQTSSNGHGHGHSHSHKKHRRETLKDDSESSGGSSSPRTSSSDNRHHSSSSKKHSHGKRNGDHHHECNERSSRSSSSSEKHKEQKSLERKSHKHSNEVEKISKKRNNEHSEPRHRQASDSDTLDSTKSNTSGGKHRERKTSKNRHSNSDPTEEKSSHSSSKEGSSSKHRHQDSSNGGTFTKEEAKKIVRDGHLLMDEDVDLTSTFTNKHQKEKIHQNGDSSPKDYINRESIDLDNIEDIYDRPKIPPVRYIPAETQHQTENDNISYKDLNLKTSPMTDDPNDDGNTSDVPLYKTVVKTRKKNNKGGSKTGDTSINNKKSSRNVFEHNEEEFIDSLQAIDAIHQVQKSGNGGFYENVGFGTPKMDKKENGFSSPYVEENTDGDDNFITVGEVLSNSSSLSKKHSKNRINANEKDEGENHLNKNIAITDKEDRETTQPLYDVPRSNPRRVSPTSLLQSATETLAAAIPSDFAAEAVYVNDGYGNEIVSSMMNSVNDDQLAFDQYDIPRSNKNLSDLIPQDYDVPKNRDSLSTIEEEHQEYDIPKPLLDLYNEKKYEINKKSPDVHGEDEEETHITENLRKNAENNDDVINDPFETNLYENQNEIFQNSSNENIYANDGVVVDPIGGGNNNLCSSHSSDDRSSGYRSSSSPSIQSEELYVNELALANHSSSLEDTHSTCSSGKHSASSPELIHHSNFVQTRTLTPVGNTIRKENNLDSYDDQSTWEHKNKSRNTNSFGRSSKNKKNTENIEKKDPSYFKEDVENERERVAFEKEILREKERERAEDVEREILRKREDNKVNSTNINSNNFNVNGNNHLNNVHINIDEANTDDMFVAKNNTLNRANLKPPETYFTESSKKKKKNDTEIILNNANDSSLGKKSLKKKAPSIPKDVQIKSNVTTMENSRYSSLKKEKDRQQKDRSVDVYNETVRQRASRGAGEEKSLLSKDVFQNIKIEDVKQDGFKEEPNDDIIYENDKDENIYVNSANIHNLIISPPSNINNCVNSETNSPSQSAQRKVRTSLYSKHKLAAAFNDIDDDDLPSVRQLRCRFEAEKKEHAITASTPQLNVTKKKPPKFAFKASKKAYNVMFSLTRRSAISMSKSLQDINVAINIDDIPKEPIEFNKSKPTKDQYNEEYNTKQQEKPFDVLEKPLEEYLTKSRTSSNNNYQKNQNKANSNSNELINDSDTLKRLSCSKTVEELSSHFETGTSIKHTRSVNKFGCNNGETSNKNNREKNDPFDSHSPHSNKKKVQDIFPHDDGCNGDASKTKTEQKYKDSITNNNNNDGHDDSNSDAIAVAFGTREENKSRNSSTMKKIIHDAEYEETGNEDIITGEKNYDHNKNANSLKRHVDRGTRRDWSPANLVSLLYQIESSDLDKLDQSSHSPSDKNAKGRIEGYLERLPPGKKKSTIWNSWKRQYFVAKGGLLLVYSDSTCGVLMDRIELCGGGRVDFMESTMLGVQDRRGHYIVIKCENDNDAKAWERILSAQTNQDVSAMFVIPKPRSPSLYTNVLVIDFGGSSVRAGIASKVPTLPQLFFPAVMAVAHDNEDEKYFGLDAFASEVRSRCQLRLPMIPSRNVDKFSIDPIALQGILEKIFKDLGLDHPGDYEVQLSAPRPFGDRAKCTIAGILFEEFGVKAVNMAHQSVFAMYAYNSTNNTGVVVDLGERMDVVPIVDGYKVTAGVSRAAVGGLEMRNKLQHYLLGRNYSLTTFTDSYITRYAIENMSYMARNFDRELQRCQRNPEKITRELKIDGCPSIESGVLVMGSERFEACEGLFKPELWGLDQAGVHVLVHKAIRECGVDLRKEMTQNIFLAGGLTMIPGFRERLELEVERLNPSIKPIVHASPYRYHAAYIGACVNAASTAFNQTKITRSDFVDAGRRLNKLWTL